MTPEQSAILLSVMYSLFLPVVVYLAFKVGQLAKVARALELAFEAEEKDGADAEQRHAEDKA